jgi:purine-binding chemotaxis protein CheW
MEETAQNPVLEKFLIFTVQGKRYALPSKFINEVAAIEKVFPLPLVPDYVRGIINRYSIPYALIDICFLFIRENSNAQKMIVLKETVDKLALLIDDVTDIADLAPESLLKTESEDNTGSISAYFEWKGCPVFCIDAGDLITRIKQDFEQYQT